MPNCQNTKTLTSCNSDKGNAVAKMSTRMPSGLQIRLPDEIDCPSGDMAF